MSPHSSAWLAWSVCAISLALSAPGLLFLALDRAHPGVPVFDFAFHSIVIVASCSTVGVLIASCRPVHPMGWLFNPLGAVRGASLLRRVRHLRAGGGGRVAAECRLGSLAGCGCHSTNSRC
jgi:hypothetical protein